MKFELVVSVVASETESNAALQEGDFSEMEDLH